MQEVGSARVKSARELAHVEDRVRAAIDAKNETIAALQAQIRDTTAELRATQDVLERQRHELDI